VIENVDAPPVRLTDDHAVVEVRKVHTRNGVRLEIAAPDSGRAIRLCPLELETLTWQSHDVFADLRPAPGGADAGIPMAEIADDLPGDLPGSPPVELANEYALVHVRTVRSDGDERLEIVARRLGHGIRLAAHELETLTRQTHETFSEFLRTPFGPEGEAER
jgi:hypothetical protein